ncbi:MAG: hypothetical protein SFZ23_06550 [Planctomycetota bacterium]|nr:hypothetical protein [Planctomycetota bacterium]
MMRLAGAALLCAAGGLAQAQVLYGVASFTNFGSQSLYSINPSTGSATLIGNTGLRQIAGLDWDGGSGRLIALTASGDSFALNTSTGAATRVVDANFGVPEGSIALETAGTFAPIFDNLHRWNGAGWSLVGPSGLAPGADISGLDGTGTALFGLALNDARADQLVRFDTNTGVASVVGDTGTNGLAVGGLAFDWDLGRLFMTDGLNLYSINTSTGAASSIGSLGVAGFSGLAYVPAPGAATMVLAGALAASRRRR